MGDTIPADCIFIEAQNKLSFATPPYLNKILDHSLEVVKPEMNLTLVYKGSIIKSGYGKCVVCAVGPYTLQQREFASFKSTTE